MPRSPPRLRRALAARCGVSSAQAQGHAAADVITQRAGGGASPTRAGFSRPAMTSPGGGAEGTAGPPRQGPERPRGRGLRALVPAPRPQPRPLGQCRGPRAAGSVPAAAK